MNRGLTIVYMLTAVILVAASLAVDNNWGASLSGREGVAIVIFGIGMGLFGAAVRGVAQGE